MPAVLLLLLTLAPLELDQGGFPSLFESREYRYTGGHYQDELFRYRLFVPEPDAAGKKMPLILWFHGYGEGGDDNWCQLRWLDRFVMPFPWRRERYPFFVLAVQCAPDNRSWAASDSAKAGDNMVDVAAAILDSVLQECPVDPDRVYLSGVSSGGSGCWEFAVRHPQYCAAVAPFASAGTTHPDLPRLAGIPTWAFHSSGDRMTPVWQVRRTVDALKQAGGTVELTEVSSMQHDCWSEAFTRYHVLDWMLSQRRGQTSWRTSPATASLTAGWRDFASGWRWWQIFAQFSVCLTLIGLVAVAINRRRQAARSRAAAQGAIIE